MKKSKKTLREYKEEYQRLHDNKNYDLMLDLSFQIKKDFSKNSLGYKAFIEAKTNDYKKWLDESELKMIKEDFDSYLKFSKKQDQKKVWDDYNEYLNDCKEAGNLNRIKKELTSKWFLSLLYHDIISFINQNISTFNNYNIRGKRIVNVYDFINGIFYLFCMIFNLINRNYLLFLTIPFGIFGIITIYSFLNMNFIKKDNLFFKRPSNKKMIDLAKEKISLLRLKLDKINKEIQFIEERKASVMSRIPSSFYKQLKNVLEADEKGKAVLIHDKLKNDNIATFSLLITQETTLNADEVIHELRSYVEAEDDLSSFIKIKLDEIKNGLKKSILMKDVKPVNYVITVLLLLISVVSFVVLIKNSYEVNVAAFTCAVITGFVSMFIYNIKTGRNNSVIDAFNDNLLSSVFNATLMYDLVYFYLNGYMNFTYAIIEIPIIFILILIGFVMLVSLLKYNHLLRRLRETKKNVRF